MSAPGSVAAGSQLTYAITVTNSSMAQATNVVVTNILQPGVGFVSGSGCLAPNGNTVTCLLGSIGANGTAQLLLTVSTPVATGSITNVAGLISDQIDLSPQDNWATATTTLTLGAPPPPTNLVATATTTTKVYIAWGPSNGATGYSLERRGPSESFHVIASGATLLSFTDIVTASAAYLYRARASGFGGTWSPYSNTDVATAILFTDPSLTVGVTVARAVHITELRTAVNSLRATAGIGASTWTDASLANVVVKAVHVQELRTALNQALSALSLSVPTYTDPTLTPRSTTIKKVHIDELRKQVI